MRSVLYGALALMVAAPSLQAQVWNDCKYDADRSVTLNAADARLLNLDAGSGSLRVEGKPGLTEVRIRGKACASSRDVLENITLDARRDGNSIVVKANKHEENHQIHIGNYYARLDLVVEVPAGMAANIDDGSGSMELSGLGDVNIDDGSGEITAHDLGAVHIDDGSGSITLTDIRGRVDIQDNSGGIELRNIAGAIDIDDGSGEIDVRVAKSNVRVSDSSGSISVADVDGDFIVTRDGSGGIDYDHVRGRVDIPSRRHR